ncbi:venom acid phosphatase Acph-1-like [Agrilus planipennis]|uniref:acid phosphatase n=1 Tax=Agrilus planipennis TaxID=224129 RepID=A0A7F5QYQ8_AGRPL|nr:venom acid phosphatase Acph-1-like [Agrilus planipennis]
MKLTLFFGFLIFFIQSLEGNKQNSTIELVHVFFRHGSRTPEEKDLYPNDIYGYKTFASVGYGQLTNLGKQRAYRLGKLLRRQYSDFLGAYNTDVVHATSTDFDRTKMTALLVLAGLFPPAEEQKWDKSLRWLPIPYHYEKHIDDFVLRRPNEYCPAYMKELKRVLASDEVQKVLDDNSNVFEYISKHSGKNMTTLADMFSIYQTLSAEDYMNLTLPKWTSRVFPGIIHHLAGKQCEFENHNLILKKLNGGRILSKVIDQMVQKANRTLYPEGRKMYLYSGHENNVINVLSTLNLFVPHVPKYSAAVFIELHRLEDNSRAVKIYYAKHISSEPRLQKLPQCEELCPFERFLEITSPYIPINYTAECESDALLD